MTTVTLSKPLKIDVEALSKYLPDLRYRGPFESFGKVTTSEYLMDDNRGSYPELILGFDGKTEDGFTEIVSYLSAKELSSALAGLPPEARGPIEEALKGTKLELPELSIEGREEFARKAREQEAKNKLLKDVNAVGQPTKYARFTSEDARGILQHGFGYTDANSDKPIIGTFGAGPCVAMAIYNPKTKTAALAHIDGLTTLSSIEQMFTELSKDSDATLQVHLAGGDGSSREMVDSLLDRITSKDNVEIKSADLVPEGSFGGKSLAIDARTGEVYTEVRHNQLDSGKDASIRMQMIGMQFSSSPLTREYDGRGRSSELAKPIVESQEIESKVDIDLPRSSVGFDLGRTIQQPRSSSLMIDSSSFLMMDNMELSSGPMKALDSKTLKMIEELVSSLSAESGLKKGGGNGKF